MRIINREEILVELSCDWFLSNYESYSNSFQHFGCSRRSDNNYGVKSAIGKTYFEPLTSSFKSSIKEIVTFNDSILFLNGLIHRLYLSHSELQNKISTFSNKIESFKQEFTALQKYLHSLKALQSRFLNFIDEFIISRQLIDTVTNRPLNRSYATALNCLLDKSNIMHKYNLKGTNIEKELRLLCNSLTFIAMYRLKNELELLFSEQKLSYISAHSSNVKFTSFTEKCDIIEFFMKNVPEFSIFETRYSSFVSELLSKTSLEIEKLCSGNEFYVSMTSKEYDRYYSGLFEREQILNVIYLLNSEKGCDSTLELYKESQFIEEIFFRSQRIIYKIFLDIYEISRRLFTLKLENILKVTFSDHLTKILHLFKSSIFKSNDIIGLSIIYAMSIKFRELARSKFIVFENGLTDTSVLFSYFHELRETIYSSVESSVIQILNSLTSIGFESTGSFISDKATDLHPTSRRVSELLSLLIKLVNEPGNNNEQFKRLIYRVQLSLAKWFKLTSDFLQNESGFSIEESCIYIINNVDIIISTLEGNDDSFLDIFRNIFNDYSQKYIENRISRNYSEIHEFIKQKPRTDEVNKDNLRDLLDNFNSSWRSNIEIELQRILRSFLNFHTSEEILKLLGTAIAAECSHFIKILNSEYNIADVEKSEVSVEEILNYIHRCLYPGENRYSEVS
ncbi:vacuolar protein sorting-associated protein 52 isoform X2 [Cryptosporidium felis]|nr:vacuolar protein sorting-associated protein 52 isoform X2 [Cryptosporidium felis]